MKFTVNGNEYEGAKYDYNAHCEMQEMGVDVLEIKKKPMLVARAYFALSAGLDTEEAGKEIEKHIIGGGDLGDIIVALLKEMEQSDFFQSIIQKSKKDEKSEKAVAKK